jgi:hypothetical protein
MHQISKTPWVIFRALSVSSLFTEKCLLDNTTGIRYLNSNRLLLDDDCRFFWFHYILGCIRLPHTTLSFPLLRSKKGNSYQFRYNSINQFNFGFPSICFGPDGSNCHSFDEFVELDSLVLATKAVALATQEWCSLEKMS